MPTCTDHGSNTLSLSLARLQPRGVLSHNTVLWVKATTGTLVGSDAALLAPSQNPASQHRAWSLSTAAGAREDGSREAVVPCPLSQPRQQDAPRAAYLWGLEVGPAGGGQGEFEPQGQPGS